MKIGFVGLGSMGRPIAERLLAAGHRLTVHNRTPEKAEPLIARGAAWADSPGGAAAGNEIVVTMLADDDAELAVLEGAAGLLAADFRGIHVACTTLAVAGARRIAELHRAAAQSYVSCPVLGRPDAAAAGKLWGLLAGPPESVERVRPVLAAFTQGVFELGAAAERANLCKLVANFSLLAAIETLGETLALAEKGGIPRRWMVEILTSTFYPGPVFRNYGNMVAEHRYQPAGFAARLGLKDARLALAAGEELGVPLPLASLVRDVLVETLAKDRGDWDWAALGRIASEHAGL